MPSDSQMVIDSFHKLWYDAPETWLANQFLGLHIYQAPSDMMIYHDILCHTRPKVVIQTGVASGGSLLWFTQILRAIGISECTVIGVDVELRPEAVELANASPNIVLIESDSAAPEAVAAVAEIARGRTGMVSLDSDHASDHVLSEMKAYEKFVGPGDFLVVEDTNLGGRPVRPDLQHTPADAVEAWLREPHDFSVSAVWERHLFTLHTWLRRAY